MGADEEVLNLEGASISPDPLPAGFTKGGVVALVFSCLAAVAGLAAVSWYGVGELKGKEEEEEGDAGEREK